jgi:hypothetical protein
VCLAVAIACRREPSSSAPTVADDAAPPPSAAHPPAEAVSTPIPEGPVLVVRNRSNTTVQIYGAYLVDRNGELGTRSLWPHPSDCPGVPLPPRTVDAGGMLLLPPPTDAYVGESCTPTKLPDGDYVVRLDSGHGEQLYAAAPMTLPLTGPVELEMKNHDKGPPCDAALARRAARLAFATAGPLPAAWARECEVDRARCGTLPLERGLPPKTCTITLHEDLLIVERAASKDAPRSLEAWMDPEIVGVQRTELRRTSASRVVVGGKPIVIAGETSQHRHEHGGDAASIGGARFIAHNPHSRPLRLRVRGVEMLEDSQCGLPNEVKARPKPAPDAPTKLAPGQSELVIGFEPQGAYQVHCDRFATRVTFEVEGKRIAATVEHEVMRFEPMRH